VGKWWQQRKKKKPSSFTRSGIGATEVGVRAQLATSSVAHNIAHRTQQSTARYGKIQHRRQDTAQATRYSTYSTYDKIQHIYGPVPKSAIFAVQVGSKKSDSKPFISTAGARMGV
jgi:hypothetical protein